MSQANYITQLGGFSDAGGKKLMQMSRDSKVMSEFLRFQGRVFKQSPSVALEFFIQKPETQFIATAAQWDLAGKTVRHGERAIQFMNHEGEIIGMYDFSQCDAEIPPPLWTISSQNAAAVRSGFNVPENISLLESLVKKACTNELVIETMQRLGIPPQQFKVFGKSMTQSIGEIIAGRLSIGGGNFNVKPDHTAYAMLRTNQQRMMFLALSARAARGILMEVERCIIQSATEKQLEKQEVQSNGNIRGMEENVGRGQRETAGERVSGNSERTADQLTDESNREESERRVRMGDNTGVPEQEEHGMVSGVQADGSGRNADVVYVQPVRGDVLPERELGTVNGGGTDRNLRDAMDALHGEGVSGMGGSPEIRASVSDGSTEDRQERVGVPAVAGRTVREGESASGQLRGDDSLGKNTAVPLGQHRNARDDSRTADSSNGRTGRREITQEPLTDSDSGFSAPISYMFPITSEQREAILRDFQKKHGLEGTLFVKQNRQASSGTDKVYDLILKSGNAIEYQAQLFVKHDKETFSAKKLLDSLAVHEESVSFRNFLSNLPRSLFDLNDSSDMPAEAEGKVVWSILHDSDDANGNPTVWSAQIDNDEYGKFVWIEKSENGYDVVIDSGNGNMAVLGSFDSFDIAQNYVEEKMLGVNVAEEELFSENRLAKFVIRQQGDLFNVQLWQKTDSSSDFAYSGNGRFCNSIEDARVFAAKRLEEYNAAHRVQPESTIHFGNLGNGITCYDTAHTDAKTGDFQTVAHISETGHLTWREIDYDLADEDDNRITEMANRQRDRFIARWVGLSIETRFSTILASAKLYQMRQIADDTLTMEEKVRKYEKSIIFGDEEFPLSEPKFEVYQLKSGEEYRYQRWQSFADNRDANLRVTDYDRVYAANWRKVQGYTAEDKLNNVFTMLNADQRPEGFNGHSLSMSDVVLVTENGQQTAYYVDRTGFAEYTDFLKPKDAPQPIDIQGYDLTVDFAQTPFLRMEYQTEEYLGGMDENGHERKDNFGAEDRILTVSSQNDGSVTIGTPDGYERNLNPYNDAERESIAEEIKNYLDGADFGTLRISGGEGRNPLSPLPQPEKTAVTENQPEWSYYIIADLSTWSVQSGGTRSPLERFNTADEAIARFRELRNEPYNSETIYAQNQNSPVARLTLGVSHSSGKAEFDLLHVRGGQNYLCTDYLRNETAMQDAAFKDTLPRIAQELGIDRVIAYDRNADGSYSEGKDLSFAEWTAQRRTERQNDAVRNRFMEMDLPHIMAKGVLSWDEIEDMSRRFLDEAYIDRFKPNENAVYGNGLHEPDLYAMIRQQRNGENITRKLVVGLLGNRTEMTFDTGMYDEMQAHRTETGYTLTYHGANREVTFEQIEDAFMKLFRDEYAEIQEAIAKAEAENSIKMKPAETGMIREGDRYRYLGREYEVTNLDGGIYPDDVVVMYDDPSGKYRLQQNIDRFQLMRDGEFLGNSHDAAEQTAQPETVPEDFTEREKMLAVKTRVGDLRKMLAANYEQGKEQLRKFASDYVDNLVTEQFSDDDAFIMHYFGDEHDRIVDDVFEQAYQSVDNEINNIYQIVKYSEDSGDDDGQSFRTLDEAVQEGKAHLAFNEYDGFTVLNTREHKIEYTEGDFPSTGIFSEQVYRNSGMLPESEESDTAAQLSEMVKEANRKTVEQIETGDYVTLPEGVFVVDQMDGDFSISMTNTDAESLASQKSYFGKWKEQMLQEAGDTPIVVTKADVVKELQQQRQAEIPADRQMQTVRNLNQLKKKMEVGMQFEITAHNRPECVGEHRIVTSVNSVGFTSQKLDADGNPDGRDIHMEWGKAPNWKIDNGTFSSYLNSGNLTMQFHFISGKDAEQEQTALPEAIQNAAYDRVIDLINDFCEREYGEPAVTDEPARINIAYTTDEETEKEIQVYADLETLRLVTEYDGKAVRIERFESLDAMADALDGISFDDLTALSREEKGLETSKKRGQTQSERLYKMFCEMYPDIASGAHEHERYNSPENDDEDDENISGYEPLSVEHLGGDMYSWATTYVQNGDLMDDPDIAFRLDHENQRLEIIEFQMDGVPNIGTYYVRCEDENGNVDALLRKELERTMMQNLENARLSDRVLIRYTKSDGETVIVPHDKEEEPVVIPVQPAADDKSPELRAMLNAFAEEHGLGNLSVDMHRYNYQLNETFADGYTMKLGDFYSDNNTPDEIRKGLEKWTEQLKRQGIQIDNASRRKTYEMIHKKAELPPVPDLPEIVYAENPQQKARENITAIRELMRLRRFEEQNRPLYERSRSNEYSKETSDMKLRRYSGWGGLQDVFNESKAGFAADRDELKRILTEQEYAAIRSTVTDAHYTSQFIVDAMYKAVMSMGLQRDSRILEPACGTGNFISRMPHGIGGSGVVGVEIDPITAEIAKRLNNQNPDVTIMNCPFERSGLANNSFDLVIGNVPFGEQKLFDPDYTDDWLIHDAFFRKALDKVAAGGVVAFITSSGTMDKKNSKIREYIAERADLIGAVRLPNTAFAEAGTGVTADIVFLKKRETPLLKHEKKPDWVHLATDQNGLLINSYFVENPQMVLGTMRKTSFYDRLTCDPITTTPLEKQLDAAISNLRAQITVKQRAESDAKRAGRVQAWGNDQTFQVKDGKIYFRDGDNMEEVTKRGNPLTDKNREIMITLIELRKITRELLNKQKTNCTDEELMPLRKQLNEIYDTFYQKHGERICSPTIRLLFGKDADYPILQSLEKFDSATETYSKADVFRQRTVNPLERIESVNTLEEAYQVSLDRHGKPDVPYIAMLLSSARPDAEFEDLQKDVFNELLGTGMCFVDPQKPKMQDDPYSQLTDRAEYLSGNVRQKLVFAQESAERDPAFQRNVDALKQVVPEDIHAEEITVRMGCTWIDPEDYTKFLQELSGRSPYARCCDVHYFAATGEFQVTTATKQLTVNEESLGIPEMNFYKIAEKILNQSRIVIKKEEPSPVDPTKTISRTDAKRTRLAHEKARQIEEKFAAWIFADEGRREKYERRYNDLFNSLVGRQYDGSHLTFDGMAVKFNPRQHQLDCIARTVYGGNTLAAHVVGAGKSAVFISSVMKKKQLGLINKACVVVPKALTEQTAREWLSIFPDAKLLTVSEMDLSTPAKRQTFTARIATGDYDAVILSREHFDKMPMSAEYQRNYIQSQIDDLEDMLTTQKQNGANAKTPSVKKIEGAKKKLQAQLSRIFEPKANSTRRKDMVLDFQQLGFDYLVVDEAHAYKNGFVSTKMGDVSGVSTAPSDRAQDMQMKCDYFNEQLGQGHILFCTGTPVSNSMTEMYVMTRYLRPDLLRAAGVERFDDWAATFGKVIAAYKQSASGELKMKTSFSKFANLPELMAMYKEFADIQSAEKLQLPRPSLIGGKPEIVKVQASPEQREYVADLARRAERITNGAVDPHEDNLLKITGEARLIGLGNRAVAALYRQKDDGHGELPEGFQENENGKVDECVDRVLQYYHDTEELKGVQIIFSDIAVNSEHGNFSVYDYIRDELIAKGIPKDEIIFAPKADSKERAEIFRAINEGQYRVVIGSTGTIGTGANIQKKLYACHHIDIPWKPSDFEQREGRILRQGNQFEAVRILNYVTEGTLDSYLYQVVTDKARFIAQLLDDKCPSRVSEDCDEKVLTYAELQAAAEGRPEFRERIEVGNRIAELNALKDEHNHEMGEMRVKIASLPQMIESKKAAIVQMEADKKSVDALRDSATGKVKEFALQRPMGTLRKHEDINAYLLTQIQNRLAKPFDEMPSYKIGDFTVSVQIKAGTFDEPVLAVKGKRDTSYYVSLNKNEHSDNWQRIVNFLESGIDKEIEQTKKDIEKCESDLQQAKDHVNEPFALEGELQEAQKKYAELEAKLSGLSEQKEEVFDPDNMVDEESAEEHAKRKAFEQRDDDDLEPDEPPMTNTPHRKI